MPFALLTGVEAFDDSPDVLAPAADGECAMLNDSGAEADAEEEEEEEEDDAWLSSIVVVVDDQTSERASARVRPSVVVVVVWSAEKIEWRQAAAATECLATDRCGKHLVFGTWHTWS